MAKAQTAAQEMKDPPMSKSHNRDGKIWNNPRKFKIKLELRIWRVNWWIGKLKFCEHMNSKCWHHGYLDGEKDSDAPKKGGDRGGGPSYTRRRTLKNLNIYRWSIIFQLLYSFYLYGKSCFTVFTCLGKAPQKGWKAQVQAHRHNQKW